MANRRCFVALAISVGLCAIATGQGRRSSPVEAEEEYYKLLRFETPPGEVLEAGAIETLPDGKVAVGTRRGEIWMIEKAFENPPANVKFTRFAAGLHEVLGLAYRDGWLYAQQRGELTKLKDVDGDGRADVFKTV